MNTSRHSLLITALSCMAVVIGLSQAPAKAQVNALQQLSREMIGSSFEEDTSTTLPGSPSLVEGGRGTLNRVMTDLVDEEIRRRPLPAAQPSNSSVGPQTVQLLVPIRTGLEFRKIQAILPHVKILEMNGRVFVLVDETTRALPAYKLGRQLQDRLGVVFELAYSDHHPDLNQAWLPGTQQTTAKAPPVNDSAGTIARTAKTAHSIQKPEIFGSAEDLSGLRIQSPWMTAAQVSESEQQPVAESVAQSVAGTKQAEVGTSSEAASVATSSSSSLQPALAELKAMRRANPQLAEEAEPSSIQALMSEQQPVAESVAQSVAGTKQAEVATSSETASVATTSSSSLQPALAELKAMRRANPQVAEEAEPSSIQVLMTEQQPVAESVAQSVAGTKQAEAGTSSEAASVATTSSSSLQLALAELKAMRRALAVSTLKDASTRQRASRSHQPVEAQQTQARSTEPPKQKRQVARSKPSSSLIQAVAIQPINLGNIPLVSHRYMAANQNLAYVYVKIRREAEIASLKKHSSVAAAHYRNGELMARVGVYTHTRVGHRLQRTQIEKLKQAGFEIEVIANSNAGPNQVNA